MEMETGGGGIDLAEIGYSLISWIRMFYLQCMPSILNAYAMVSTVKVAAVVVVYGAYWLGKKLESRKAKRDANRKYHNRVKAVLCVIITSSC